jgi:hypothetical protein
MGNDSIRALGTGQWPEGIVGYIYCNTVRKELPKEKKRTLTRLHPDQLGFLGLRIRKKILYAL